MRIDSNNFNWFDLTDRTSGKLKGAIERTITENSNDEIANIFNSLVDKRNRIIHSFQITYEGVQLLATKDEEHNQFIITEEYLCDFIKENELLSSKLHEFRGS